jgi:hypothetical protein
MPVYKVAITLLVGVALVSCSAEPAAAPPPVTTPATTFTPPAPVPATNAEYQALLTAFDQAMAPPMDAVAAAGSPDAVQAARVATLQALKPQISNLIDVVPPVAVAAAHRAFMAAIASAEKTLLGPAGNTSPAKENSCGVVLDVMPATKNNATAWARDVPIKPLVDAGFTVGAFVKPVVPEPTESTENRRAANGKIIQRAGPRGRGRLEITNGADADFAVSAVSGGDPKKPQVTIYVRAGATATITGISGTYEVFFKTGADWDDGRRGFTRGCSYEKFEQPFDQSSNWRISLEKSIAGNARTDDVPPF